MRAPLNSARYHSASSNSAKLEGEETVEAEAPATAKVIDLMSALRASVEATKAAKPARGAKAGRPAAKAGGKARPAARRRKAAAG